MLFLFQTMSQSHHLFLLYQLHLVLDLLDLLHLLYLDLLYLYLYLYLYLLDLVPLPLLALYPYLLLPFRVFLLDCWISCVRSKRREWSMGM